MDRVGFLSAPGHTPEAQAIFDEDTEELGYVMNVSKLWAYQPDSLTGLFALMRQVLADANLSLRQRGVLVAAAASARRDSYCSLAWGSKLAATADAGVAASVLRGEPDRLADGDKEIATWARKVVEDPNSSTESDIRALEKAGFDDRQIFAMTAFIALRLAFSTINDALGAVPDEELRSSVPSEVLSAVDYGRS